MTDISHIDHVAIAVRSIARVRDFYETALGLRIGRIEEMPERGIRTAFIPLGATTIELIEPMHEKSEISPFLQKRGPGIHHIALRSDDVDKTCRKLSERHIALVYGSPRPGAHGTMVNFIHPRSAGGVLLEIVG